MKKFLFFAASLLCCLLLAVMPTCKKEAISAIAPQRISSHEYYREMYGAKAQSAIDLASKALTQLYPKKAARLADEEFGISIEFYDINTVNNIFGSEFDSNDTILYIINFTDNNGFAVVNNELDLLALSDSSNITISDLLTHPTEELFRHNPSKAIVTELINKEGWKEAWCSIAHISGELAYMRPDSVVVVWDTIELHGPLVKLKLGQNYPYNAYCPPYTNDIWHRYPAGCASIAISGLMSVIGDGIYEYSWDDIYNNWVTYFNMNYGITRSMFPDITTDPDALPMDVLSKYIYEVGNELGMTYSALGSTSATNTVVSYLTDHGYDANLYDIETCVNLPYRIKYGYTPIYIRGQNSLTTVGHAWLLDGVASYKTSKRIYHGQHHYDTECEYRYDDLVHCNFGWDGECDGYYVYKMFDPTSSPIYQEYGDQIGNHGSYYTNELKVILF